MLTDSMLTLQGISTTFENAEKLIELGGDKTPAAAMISGAGAINGKLVSILLRRASAQVEAKIRAAVAPMNHGEVVATVKAVIDPEWALAVAVRRTEAAAHFSKLDELTKINEQRAQLGLAPLPQVLAKDISIDGEPDNDPDALIRVDFTCLTVVVGTYFDDDPRVTEIWWPRRENNIALPALAWWGYRWRGCLSNSARMGLGETPDQGRS